VLEKKPGRKRELAEVRGIIEERLLSSLRSDAQKAYVAALRAKAAIVVNDESLALVSVRPGQGQSAEP
jgi:hypothetical protein